MGSIDEILKTYTIDKDLDPKMIDQMINNSIMHDQEDIEVKVKEGIFKKISNFLGFEVNPLIVFAPSGGVMAMGILGIMIGMNGGIIGTESQTSTLLDPLFYQETQLNNDVNSVFEIGELAYAE